MNKHIIALLVVIALATVIAAPVIATGRAANVGKCSSFMKFDKKSKSCQHR